MAGGRAALERGGPRFCLEPEDASPRLNGINMALSSLSIINCFTEGRVSVWIA